MSAEPILTCGIVSHNDQDVIAEAIGSVLNQEGMGHVCRLIVWDNASSDCTPQIVAELAARDERLQLVRHYRNLGFGRAHNRILAMVESDYHVFCNPDIYIQPGALAELVRMMEERPTVGLAAPRVLNPDGSLQPLNKRDPRLFDLFLRRFVPPTLRAPFKERLARYEMRDVGYDEPCEVPFLSGAFLMGRVRALAEVGGFDDRFFLYFEDADLSRKMRATGWTTLYWSGAVVVHHWRREAHTSLRGAGHFMMSALRYFNKWGWAW